MRLGRLLFDELAAAGVRHLFGIPGDMALNLFRAAEESPVRIVTTTNELTAGYAADFYARANGLGVLVVTFNVGTLSALNAVAEAMAERSPLLIVMGAPGRGERRGPVALHHETVHDPRGGATTQSRVYQAAGVRRFGPNQVSQAIAYVKRACRPAFIEIPRDLADTDVPQEPAPSEIPDGVEEAAGFVRERLRGAHRPVLIAGTETSRYGLNDALVRWAERLQVPVVGTMLGKSAFPEVHPLYCGVYFGQFSECNRDLVAESDCVINVGEQWTDFNLGLGTSPLNYAEVLHLTGAGVFYKGDRVLRTPLSQLLPALADQLWKPAWQRERARDVEQPRRFGLSYLASAMPEDVLRDLNLVVDVGDSFMLATLVRMPRVNSFFMSPYYASMGMSVPGALGVTLAAGRRSVVVIGDGSFQMGMGAVSDCVRHAAHPILILLNNRSYATLRVMEATDHPYLSLPAFDYVALGTALGCRAARARSPHEFDAAWQAALRDREHTHLIEMVLSDHQISEPGQVFCDELRKHVKG